jgi:hypothetical protein
MIWSLLVSDEIRNAFTHTDILDLIQSTFIAHSQVSNVVQICCACLQRLSKDSVCKSLIVKEGLFANVCVVAGSAFSKSDVSVAQSSVGAIWNLMHIKGTEDSSGPGDNKDIGKIFVESGGVTALSDALNVWGDKDLIVAKNACGALWFAATHDAVQKEISRLETLSYAPQPSDAVSSSASAPINPLSSEPPNVNAVEKNVDANPVSEGGDSVINNPAFVNETCTEVVKPLTNEIEKEISGVACTAGIYVNNPVSSLIGGLAKSVKRFASEDVNVSRNVCNALDWLLNVGM